MTCLSPFAHTLPLGSLFAAKLATELARWKAKWRRLLCIISENGNICPLTQWIFRRDACAGIFLMNFNCLLQVEPGSESCFFFFFFYNFCRKSTKTWLCFELILILINKYTQNENFKLQFKAKLYRNCSCLHPNSKSNF